jgi:hypothetical protein
MKVGEELNTKVNELAMYREVLRTAPTRIDELEYQKVKQKLRAGMALIYLKAGSLNQRILPMRFFWLGRAEKIVFLKSC